jgi:hypothetical protein
MMDRKLFKTQEIVGIALSLIVTFIMWQVYSFTQGNPIGVIFGSVNGSIWEHLKGLIVSYVLFGGLELFTSKPHFRQFVVAKAFGLYGVIFVYIILRHLTASFLNIYVNCGVALIALVVGFVISYLVTTNRADLRDLFMPSFFMLVLLFVMFFSFSVFPPKLVLFQDPDTGLYGIIPDYIDTGAIILNSIATN